MPSDGAGCIPPVSIEVIERAGRHAQAAAEIEVPAVESADAEALGRCGCCGFSRRDGVPPGLLDARDRVLPCTLDSRQLFLTGPLGRGDRILTSTLHGRDRILPRALGGGD